MKAKQKANFSAREKLKVLVIGFSVTEMPTSYIPIAKEICSNLEVGIEIVQCGIGGITTESLPYFIEDIIARHQDCQHVVFEVATSYVRQVYNEHLQYRASYINEIWQQFDKLISVVRAAGKTVYFFNLPRIDVNYENDYLESSILKVSSARGVSVFSVSNELHLNGIDPKTLIYDDVHPNPSGALYYAQKLVQFLRELVLRDGKIPDAHAVSRYNHVKLARHADVVEKFSRHGYVTEYVRITEKKPLTIKLDEEYEFEGFSVLCGPKSGLLKITTDTVRTFMCYDQYCYYERMMTSVQPLGQAREILFEIDSIVPEIDLLKGEKDAGPREIGLIYMFTQK